MLEPGQPVECVDASGFETVLVQRRIYTVREFGEHRCWAVRAFMGMTGPAVWLEEVRLPCGVSETCARGDWGFEAWRFRPLDKRSIEKFTKLLESVPRPQRVKEKA